MKKPKDYESVQASGSYENLPAGGYVCKIINAEERVSQSGKDMIVLTLDVSEGDRAGIFKRKFDGDTRDLPKWPNGGMYYQVIYDDEGNTKPSFKGMCTSIEESNTGFTVKWGDIFPACLIGKSVGVLFGEEEYVIRYGKRQGEIGVSVKPTFLCSAGRIREGDFDVPLRKPLGGQANRSKKAAADETSLEDFFNIPANDLPFG